MRARNQRTRHPERPPSRRSKDDAKLTICNSNTGGGERGGPRRDSGPDQRPVRPRCASSSCSRIPTPSAQAGVITLTAELPVAPSNKDYITPVLPCSDRRIASGLDLHSCASAWTSGSRTATTSSALGAPILAIVPRVPGWRNRGDAKLVSVTAPEAPPPRPIGPLERHCSTSREKAGSTRSQSQAPARAKVRPPHRQPAVSLAQIGKRVVMISCDLRKPRLHRFFGHREHGGSERRAEGCVDAPRSALQDAGSRPVHDAERPYASQPGGVAWRRTRWTI